MKTYAVIGLGYVGLGLAVALAKSHSVFGYDINENRIQSLNDHIDLNRLLSQEELAASSARFTDRLDDIRVANFYIVAVSTPAYFYEMPNLEPLVAATKMLGSILKKDDIVVFESTVYPGTTEDVCIPILERESGLKNGEDFHVAYSPERINPGDREHTLKTITKIISAQNEATLNALHEAYGSVCDKVHPVSCIAVAEAIKVLENSQRDVNIAFMNETAKIMHALGLDMHEIIEGAKTKWSFAPFKPGLVGGHCISIDSHYLAFKAKRQHVYPDLLLAARKVNDDMTQFLIRSMIKLLIKHKIDTSNVTVGIFGVSYKENTPDTRNSLSLKLIKELKEYGFQCRVHDPLKHNVLYDVFQRSHSARLDEFEAMQDLTVAMVLVGHDEYRNMGLEPIMKACAEPCVVMDIPGLFFDERHAHDGLIYWNL